MVERRPQTLAQTPEELRARFGGETVLHTDKIEIIAGPGNAPLSRKIAELVDKKLGEPIDRFADGEVKVNKVPFNLRKKGVFIIQSMHPEPDRRIMELIAMIDAVRKASAADIALVIPYLAYMRQDKKDDSRVPITAALIPEIVEGLGVDRMLTMDLHSEAQQGYFAGPWDTVPSTFVTIPEIQNLHLSNPVIAAPDAGGLRRAREFSKILGLGDNVIQGDKERPATTLNQSIIHRLNGEIEGRDVIIVEDIIDTAGTITSIAVMLHRSGARSITVVAPYGLFSTTRDGVRAIDRICNSPIDQIIVTNAIEPKQDAIASGKVKYVDVAPMIAEAMLCMHTGESVSERLILGGAS